MTIVNRFMVAVIIAVMLGSALVTAQEVGTCENAENAIQAYGQALSELTTQWDRGWGLLEYQVSVGSVTVGSMEWDGALEALTNIQDEIDYAVQQIEDYEAVKRNSGCR